MADPRPSDLEPSGLLVDLYELTMGQGYFEAGLAAEQATFSLFFRRLPPGWGYLIAAGLDDLLALLGRLRFGERDLAYLEETRLFSPAYLDSLREWHFTGTVRALPEGTLFFPQEPVLEVTGPVAEAQLVETIALNQIHYQSLIAAKAARCVDAARGRRLVDFGVRRAYGVEAGLVLARSSWIAGFDATSNVLAGRELAIPVAGTMAHSFVEAFDEELEAFRAFARTFPEETILLVDTYDTLEGVRLAATVGRELAERGSRLRGVRLDSGNLLELSRAARAILDGAGLEDATVFASGGLDERDLEALLDAGAPIDGFGIGSRLGTPADAPSLDMAYKLVEFAGRPTLKLSPDKATLAGRKQVWRVPDAEGSFAFDMLGLDGEEPPLGGEPLLSEVMARGRRVLVESLDVTRERASRQRLALPERHRRLDAEPYEVRLSADLAALDSGLRGER
ncbi:MAG TPA: nicotinate phosphoribosyltransferase [Gaiellaceae bacterium]|jgi:nicotinate phosphoribosyltransferase